jgi:hypothetical protein
MPNLSGIVEQLKKERERARRQLAGLNAALAAFAGAYKDGGQTKGKSENSAGKLKRRPTSTKAKASTRQARKSRRTNPKKTKRQGPPET